MNRSRPQAKVKSFDISKWMVWEAYQRVRANKGAAGVDEVSIAEFEQDRDKHLYRIWNRMSSGSYFPPPVKAVEIPKPGGAGVRVLGVPTIADRVAQTVAKMYLGATGGTGVSSGLLWLSSKTVGFGRGGDMPKMLLEKRLGH